MTNEERQQKQLILLMQHVNKQERFINDFFNDAEPIAKEINQTKNILFKIFKFIKLALKLAILILTAYNKKPEPIDFLKF